MCGRYILERKIDEVAEFFGASPPEHLEDPGPRYNIAPTQYAPVIRADGDMRQIEQLRWGLVPSWAPDLRRGARLINARSETVLQTPSFRKAIRHRRCLVPAEGFYEWRKSDALKVPHWIRPKQRTLFAFAGIWARWRNPEGTVETFSVLTTDAAGVLGDLHGRFPVIVPTAQHAAWLDPEVPAESFAGMYHPPPKDSILVTPVNRALNKVAFEGPDCLSVHVPQQTSLW